MNAKETLTNISQKPIPISCTREIAPHCTSLCTLANNNCKIYHFNSNSSNGVGNISGCENQSTADGFIIERSSNPSQSQCN